MDDSEGIDNIVNELNRLYTTYKDERYKPSSVLTKMVAEINSAAGPAKVSIPTVSANLNSLN